MPQLVEYMKVNTQNKISRNLKNNRFKSGTHHIQNVTTH